MRPHAARDLSHPKGCLRLLLKDVAPYIHLFISVCSDTVFKMGFLQVSVPIFKAEGAAESPSLAPGWGWSKDLIPPAEKFSVPSPRVSGQHRALPSKPGFSGFVPQQQDLRLNPLHDFLLGVTTPRHPTSLP